MRGTGESFMSPAKALVIEARLGWPPRDFCSVETLLLILRLLEGSPRASWLWRIILLASWTINTVLFFECSGSYFLPAGLRMSCQALSRESPSQKSEPIIFLLRAPGCSSCFRPKGMGGTSFTFPFLTLFCFVLSFLFWVHVCLSMHTCMYLSFLGPARPLEQLACGTFCTFLCWNWLCGLNFNLVRTLGRSVLILFLNCVWLGIRLVVLFPFPSLGSWFFWSPF